MATPDAHPLSLHDALPISAPAADQPQSGKSRAENCKASGFRYGRVRDRKSTRLNSSHVSTSYAVFCLKKKIIRIDLISSVMVRKSLPASSGAASMDNKLMW